MNHQNKRRCPALYSRKVAKNFGQSVFLAAREIEHGRFRAFFVGKFWPKMQSGRTSPKNKELSFTAEK